MEHYMEGFEVLPQGRRGIGEASMGKGVGGQQISELVVDDRFGDWFNRQHGGAKRQGRYSDGDHSQRASLRQPRERGLCTLELAASESGKDECDDNCQKGESGFNEEHEDLCSWPLRLNASRHNREK